MCVTDPSWLEESVAMYADLLYVTFTEKMCFAVSTLQNVFPSVVIAHAQGGLCKKTA